MMTIKNNDNVEFKKKREEIMCVCVCVYPSLCEHDSMAYVIEHKLSLNEKKGQRQRIIYTWTGLIDYHYHELEQKI